MFTVDWDKAKKKLSFPQIVEGIIGNTVSTFKYRARDKEIKPKKAKELGRALAKNKSLKSFDITANNLGTEEVIAISEGLSHNGHITSLGLAKNEINTDGARELAKALQKNASLTSLDLSENIIGDEGAQAIINSIAASTTLTSLELTGNGLEDTEGLTRALDQANPASLTSLHLAYNKLGPAGARVLLHKSSLQNLELAWNNMQDAGAEVIGEALGGNSSITSLNLAWNKIGDVGARSIGRSLAKNISLKNLNLFGNNIGTEGAQEISTALTTNTTLKALNLLGNKIGAAGARSIGESLAQNSTLTSLNLCGNHIGDSDVQELCKALAVNSGLQNLDLSKNKISHKGGAEIAKALASNASLISLNLGRNMLGNTGAQEIATALVKNNALTYLDLTRNSIGDAGSLAIIQSLNKHPTLKTLDLSNNEVSSLYPLLLSLKRNTTLTALSFPNSKEAAKPTDIRDCFKLNSTLIGGYNREPLIDWFITLNRVCKELGAEKSRRSNVPETLRGEDDIRHFLHELMAGSEEWRAMKMIVLGNGGIGKTTFVHYIVDKLNPNPEKDNTPIKSTVGIECNVVNMGKGSVSIWDFAGQLEYTVTHQFFLSDEMVVYVVCYDLSAPLAEQRRQIRYWLEYLNSLLCSSNTAAAPPSPNLSSSASVPPPNIHGKSKWKVIVVGTRSDLKMANLGNSSPLSWHTQFPNLPIMEEAYQISTRTDIQSVDTLLGVIEGECTRILDTYSKQIPVSYRDLYRELQDMQKGGEGYVVHKQAIVNRHARWSNQLMVGQVLKYLHAIGEIVLLEGGRVCTQPSQVAKIMAKFISPEEVRNGLLWDDETEVALLSKTDVDAIIGVKPGSERLSDELKLMKYFGVCFELPMAEDDNETLYLFPSLGAWEEFKFTLQDIKPTFRYEGVRLTAMKKSIFVPGLFCQFLVALCQKLNMYRHDILHIRPNGALLMCPGLMDGQLIVSIEPDAQTILFLMVASNPHLSLISDVFKDLIQLRFPQYIGYIEENLCPTCVQQYSQSKIPVNKLGVVHEDNRCRPNLHVLEELSPSQIPVPPDLCWTHGQHKHDFFLNYRSYCEGKPGNLKLSVAAAMYEKLACLKRKNGHPVYVFWDIKCLNFGQNWERGFFRGVTNSKVIVLLLSSKGLQGIKQNASTTKDNVLLEYECALLQSKRNRTSVIPIFVGEEKDKDASGNLEFEEFSIYKERAGFPDALHVRGDDANRMLQELSDTLPEYETAFLGSVAKTMDELFKLQGTHMIHRGSKQQELDSIATILMKALEERSLL